MACTATELVNRFVPALKVIDAGDEEKKVPPVFIIDGDQLFNFVGDVQLLTDQIVKRAVAKWEARYGSQS